MCLIIGPEHQAIRDHYGREAALSRVRVTFAVQERPLGTANAVAAAEAFAGADQFLVINSDNYYPVVVFEQVRRLAGPGLAGFERAALSREGNIDDARVSRYAVLQVAADGALEDIIEKPDPEAWARTGAGALISMNCWRFGPRIFDAIRQTGLSPRGEYSSPTRCGRPFASGSGSRWFPFQPACSTCPSEAISRRWPGGWPAWR